MHQNHCKLLQWRQIEAQQMPGNAMKMEWAARNCNRDIALASAVAAVVFQPVDSIIISFIRPPSSCFSGHESWMWPIVCCWSQSQSSDAAKPHLCKLTRCCERNWFSSVHDWHGKLKPSCWMDGSHTRCWLTTEADNQSSSHCVVMSMGAASAQMGQQDVSGCSGWFDISTA